MVPIHILIVDDHPKWEECMRSILSPEDDFHIISCTSDRNHALSLLHQADLVIMSENGQDEIALARQMNQIKSTNIILLTENKSNETILNAFSAGIVHCLRKTNIRELPPLIRYAVQNENTMKILLDDYARLKKDALLQELTPAEREILELINQGLSYKGIATKLFKADSTIKNQISSILKKLNVRTSKQALEKINRIAT
ncbi:LuxR C-terminal-related transcriptional regulator [Candidatus Pristimantibacillus sp. PTI5]|uniref:LuxR C-terminal-related transcriptional regulator n=1 Tax=Candidatus Pristimantibacillus sp. PTI5 TaxID=3400422 RepID=UPI003B015EA9